ncbi:MAG: cobalamin-binding protein [Paraglaciecola sp.]|nr:cobalamin-binding protein [Paraglaciecola sp.]NCT48114.1 cobalamin-binding protein [Paraglaciecola sp.]
MQGKGWQCLVLSIFLTFTTVASEFADVSQELKSLSGDELSTQRIISLAPHTTELVYALGIGERLVAVSDYSDYPPQAATLPSVANHNGLNFEAIMRLQPDLILAWQGGNKPQDLAKLVSLGFQLFYSSPQQPEDISTDIVSLGNLTGREAQAQIISEQFLLGLKAISQQYSGVKQLSVFYYLWSTPLMTVGKKTWANTLLSRCGAYNVFSDAPIDYPEVSREQVLAKHPDALIAAMHAQPQDLKSFWGNTQALFDLPLVVVNPDQLHRFSPRLLDGLNQLCEQIDQLR